MRRRQAAQQAARREEAQPWAQFRRDLLEQGAPATALLIVDAFAEQQRQLGKGHRESPLYTAYGAGTVAEQRCHPSRRPPGLADRIGRSRRHVIRVCHWLVGQGLQRQRSPDDDGHAQEREVEGRWHWGAGQSRERGRRYLIGKGGCAKGGGGFANAWWPPGAAGPAPPAPPAPAVPESDPPAAPAAGRQAWDQVRRDFEQRRSERSRAP